MKFKYLIILSIVFLQISCGTGMKIPSEQLQGINSEFKGTFLNRSYKNQTKKGTNSNLEILNLLNLTGKKSDSVSLSFTSENELIVIYDNALGKTKEYFKGEFSKKGYFEIFLSKKNIQIPPFFSILYSKTDIQRVRINLTKENELIIDSYYDRSGNVFLFAAGSSGRSQYFFKPN
mgnify:CR=1 FL=1